MFGYVMLQFRLTRISDYHLDVPKYATQSANRNFKYMNKNLLNNRLCLIYKKKYNLINHVNSELQY